MSNQSRPALHINNTDVYYLDQLRENFAIEEVIDLYKNEQLATWLEQCGYKDILDQVDDIDCDDSDTAELIKELVAIFNIDLGDCDLDLLVSTIERTSTPAAQDEEAIAQQLISQLTPQQILEVEQIANERSWDFVLALRHKTFKRKQSVDKLFNEKNIITTAKYMPMISTYMCSQNNPDIAYFLSNPAFWVTLGLTGDSNYIIASLVDPDDDFEELQSSIVGDLISCLENHPNVQYEYVSSNTYPTTIVPQGTLCLSWVASYDVDNVDIISDQGSEAICRCGRLALTDGLAYKATDSMAINFITVQ